MEDAAVFKGEDCWLRFTHSVFSAEVGPSLSLRVLVLVHPCGQTRQFAVDHFAAESFFHSLLIHEFVHEHECTNDDKEQNHPKKHGLYLSEETTVSVDRW